MENSSTKSKRIIKNTLMLYIRLLFTIIISLYTSRIILDVLGIADYGIFNVVGGVVSMFSFFSTSLSAAISRYITYELGKNDIAQLKKVFSTSVTIQLVLACILIIIIEIIGGWFLNNKMNIPVDRMNVANWIFHCSVITFAINIISVPYNAAIIAHERMNIFAYISILEVALKLLIVFCLCISPIDKLKTYGLLLVFVAIVIRVVYGVYCTKYFAECKYNFKFDKPLFKQMTSFAGWNLIGTGAYLFNTQGVNIVTNIFFGVSVNAARGIASQVDGIIKQFVLNFTTAINPQITKSYASNDKEFMFSLICKGAKYSYLLLLLFAVPFIYETDYILELWLKEVPEYTSIFLKLTLIGSLADILGNSLANAAWATGNVKKYYIYVGSIGCLPFIFSYILFYWGFPPESSYFAFIFIYILIIFIKLYIVRDLIKFPIKNFINQVLGKIIPITLVSFLFSYIIHQGMQQTIWRVIILTIVNSSVILYSTFIWGLEKSEKLIVTQKIKKLKNHL